jgi:hypothetical protein
MDKIVSTRRKRFEKVAGNRVQMILNTLDNLEKCSNKNNYQYNEDDVKKIEKSIKDRLSEVIKTYHKELNKGGKRKFSF